MQETALLLGQGRVFEESSELLSRLCGVDLSGKQVENLCHHYGEQLELAHLDEEDSIVQKKGQLHYAMVDGSYILSREVGWTETKVGRIFKASDNFQISKERAIIRESSYTAHIGTHSQFIDKISPYLDCLDQLVFIADGATWIWKWVNDCYSQATQILDFFHAYEKICEWAALVFKDKSALHLWCEQAKDFLLNDELSELVIEIENIRCLGESLNKKESLLTYIAHNAKRMTYKTFLEKGYLIGSGAIESAQRTLVQHRFKRSGQRWTLKGAQQVLNLRAKKLSNQWKQVVDLVRNAA